MPMASLQNVILEFRDGKEQKGKLYRPFNSQYDEMMIFNQNNVESIPLSQLCSISFLLDHHLPAYKKLPSELVEHIITVSGHEWVVRVLSHQIGTYGFMATPNEENTFVQRIFFVHNGIQSRELTESLGEILRKEDIISGDNIHQALLQQQKLRTQRVGDILSESGKINEQDIAQVLLTTPASNQGQRLKIGEGLVAAKLITETQLTEALHIQHQQKGKRIGDILIENRAITEDQLLMGLAIKFRMSFMDLTQITPSPEALDLIPASMALQYQALPILYENKHLTVAIYDPRKLDIANNFSFHTNLKITLVFAFKAQITDLLSQCYEENSSENIDSLLDSIELTHIPDQNELSSEENILDQAELPPIVRLINRILLDGVQAEASDVHIFPVIDGARVDFRVNGLLQQYMKTSSETLSLIIARIKIVSLMDISKHMMPQDGRIQMNLSNRNVEFRVSCMPDILGESIVLRILDKKNKPKTLDALGLSPHDIEIITRITHSSHGFFLVTGATGSGKSTSLLAAMSSLTNLPKRLISIEDPVEAQVDGINQVQINAQIGFTFALALRNLLRHDPDIMMVGEIRDKETAEIAIEAAMTGHMMLSSLHTNTAAGAFSRLNNLGIEPFLVAATVKGVMAQQLIPRLCSECRYEITPDKQLIAYLKDHGLSYDGPDYDVHGCSACHESGVGGRMLVYELLHMNKKISNLVSQNASEAEIDAAAHEAGMISMAEMALSKVKSGHINLASVVHLLTVDE
ncbi:MAG: ATPase, T2SS/T4P/T4SS family [Mariprofundaceae bacterium]|nr:ATPase, T2SS/T4P/T4SS family [Mariprofundaceae bacterium]